MNPGPELEAHRVQWQLDQLRAVLDDVLDRVAALGEQAATTDLGLVDDLATLNTMRHRIGKAVGAVTTARDVLQDAVAGMRGPPRVPQGTTFDDMGGVVRRDADAVMELDALGLPQGWGVVVFRDKLSTCSMVRSAGVHEGRCEPTDELRLQLIEACAISMAHRQARP